MEDRYAHTLNGQSVIQSDMNLLGETAALADDRVFAELFRMTPYDGSTTRKAILPAGHQTSGASAVVAPNGATGAVLVNPFRALVGSRTEAATNAKENLRDVRSAIAVGTTALGQLVGFSANASGNARWDLVYAAVAVDANTASVTRKRKDPTTKVVGGASVVTRKATTVTLGVQPGIADASPVFPAGPSDAAGVYYIPLAYVRIPSGFGASSTVLPKDIATIAPVLRLARTTGGKSLSFADTHHTLTTAQQQAWGSTGTRYPFWTPSDVSGSETVVATIDWVDPDTSKWSHAHQGVVDSRDWRGRFCKAFVMITGPTLTSPVPMPWDLADLDGLGGYGWNPVVETDRIGQALSQTITPVGVNNRSTVIYLADGTHAMEVSSSIHLYVDHADGGKLKVSRGGLPKRLFHVWLEFSGPFSNK